MAGVKRPRARIVGEFRANDVARRAGEVVRSARKRRRLTQTALASQVGLSQARLADVEAGRGAGVPLEVWFALGEALGIFLRFEFGRDPQAELRDAGHLAMQDLLLRVTKPGGWVGGFELATTPSDPSRSIDVPLVDRRRRRMAIAECWNTFGDLGAAARSSDRKVAEANQLAVAIGGEGRPFEIGLCWVVRDTSANRELIARYEHIFRARFPGSSAQWVAALTDGASMPRHAGLVWCDVRSRRLFAHRWSGQTTS